MPLIDRLTGLIAAGDLNGVDVLLRSMSDGERAEARRWFEGSKTWFRAPRNAVGMPGWSPELSGQISRIEGLCAVALCGPVTAARRVPWGNYWDHQEDPGEASLVHLLWEADRAWVATFAQAASQVRLGAQAHTTNGTLSHVLRAAVVHHGLPSPTGPTFLKRWIVRDWLAHPPTAADTLVRTLRDDPLMPGLLFGYLASGHCGDETRLPDAVKALVAEGRVDRDHLVEVVLQQLTTHQRAASQRVLAGVLSAVGVTSAEVPGGLSYLLGVLATSHGSVGKVVLPLALELIDDAAGLAELTAVVAGRPERKQKAVLLLALQGEELRKAVGDSAVIHALRHLASGEDDAGFAGQVSRALSALGEAPDGPATGTDLLGLWERTPAYRTPPGGPPPSWRSKDLPTTWRLLLSQSFRPLEPYEPWALATTLNEIAEGRFDPSVLRDHARDLLTAGELSVPRTARLLEELFLGGAMSTTWPVALRIADDACGASRRPAGVHALLRTLAAYAPEAPQQDPPRHIAALAAATSESKAAHEARALTAALTRDSVEAYLARLRTSSEVSAPAASRRGLWRSTRPLRAAPRSVRIPDAPDPDLAELRRRADGEVAGGWAAYRYLYLRDTAEEGVLVSQELLLRDVLAAARRHGACAVQERLHGLYRRSTYAAAPVGLAIDLWASGELTVPAFWKLALRARTHAEAKPEWQAEAGEDHERLQAHSYGTNRVADQIGAHVPVLPYTLDNRAARLTFLLACEALLRAGEAPTLLSTPAYEDGTLDLEDLLDRLGSCRSTGAGPLDVVQALYRLRPADRARTAALELPPLVTQPELTTPDGQESWDATAAVRTWLAAGGLPLLSSRPSADGASWVHGATAPVPWSVCRAAPNGLLDDDVIHDGGTGAVARVFPQWPDRLVRKRFADVLWDDVAYAAGLARMGGRHGLASHDYLLGTVSRSDESRRKESIDVLVELMRHDRLSPALAAEAALGRHAAGTLALPTCVQSWEQIFLRGGMAGLWPLATAVASALCDVTPKPAGLPALLRLLTAYAHEVPAPVVPEGVRRLGESRGSTRSHVEARALIAAFAAGEPGQVT
jgi:hypothetical protein